MTTILNNRITAVWLLLVALTILSLEFFQNLGVGSDHRIGAAAVIMIASIKARIVGLEYMELRNAPLPLRIIFETWIIVITAALIITLYHSHGMV